MQHWTTAVGTWLTILWLVTVYSQMGTTLCLMGHLVTWPPSMCCPKRDVDCVLSGVSNVVLFVFQGLRGTESCPNIWCRRKCPDYWGVWISEMSWFQELIELYHLGQQSVLFIEVSIFQGVLNRGTLFCSLHYHSKSVPEEKEESLTVLFPPASRHISSHLHPPQSHVGRTLSLTLSLLLEEWW